MIIDCIACVDGVPPGGGICSVCSGVGDVAILTTSKDDTRWQIHCTVWKYLLERTSSMETCLVCPTNVFDSYVILEELDATEYNALSDSQKAGIDTLLCCSKVDLREGKVGRVRLWNWFGAESTTVANLTALLE